MTPSERTSTAAPEVVIIYDGHCRFCTAQANRLAGNGGRIVLRSFHDAGVLDNYPSLTHEACMEELKLVGPDGRIYGGAEAVFRAFAFRHRFLGKILRLYYIPGIRSMADWGYRLVARNRYRIAGKSSEECDTGACKRHST
jgi:predicted DCC family thiol-disulfide oxidoreductase YuxK